MACFIGLPKSEMESKERFNNFARVIILEFFLKKYRNKYNYEVMFIFTHIDCVILGVYFEYLEHLNLKN